MKKTINIVLLILAGLAGLLIYLSVFIVDITQQALVLRFGQPVNVVQEPGLNFKFPVIDNVEYIDKRVLDLDVATKEVTTTDQKRILVDAFGRYRIVDPLRYFQAAGTEEKLQQRFVVFLDAAIRQVLGEATFEALVRDDRAALMQSITNILNESAGNFGVEIVDMRIRRADLPEANSQAIYQRMQTERKREAADIRARGGEAARRIRASADREVIVVLAEAERDSQQIRGEGDAERYRIFAEAFSQDTEFYSFYRSMQAYEAGLDSNSTRLVITPESEFFEFFTNPEANFQTQKSQAASISENESVAQPPTGQ